MRGPHRYGRRVDGRLVSVSPARMAALRALERVRTRVAYAPETLDAVLRQAGLSSADASLATRLTYGTLQTIGTLDETIDRHATRPRDLEPRVRDAMRLATYELLFLRTPDRAAVHQGVEAVRLARPQAAGLANAVLRRIAEEAPGFPWGDPAGDPAALATATGHPLWMAELLIDDLGWDAASGMLAADNEPAPLYLRTNPFAATEAEVLSALEADGAVPGPCDLPGCVLAADAGSAVRGATLKSGLAVVADAAAQAVVALAGAAPGGVIVDLAAGRGTKTLQLQAASVAAGSPATVYAIDVHDFKLSVLEDRMRDLGVPGVVALRGDGTRPQEIPGIPAPGSADIVVVDAPCSGLGTLRRRPDRRWRLALDGFEPLAALQSALLESAASLVAPGGIVLYSTCSVARRENHDVAAAFLSGPAGKGFSTRDVSQVLPAAWRRWIGPEGWMQTVPQVAGPDGHFAAVLQRVG